MTSANSDLSIIIACFNEETTIEECLNRTLKVLPDAEIIVVHGGTDKTAEKARAIAAEHPSVRVIKNYGDSGKGHAVKIGISVARANLMAQLDADLQFMPEEIEKVMVPLRSGKAELAFGARFMRESDVKEYNFSFFRVMGNRIVNHYYSFLTGKTIYDVTTGLKVWTRKAIEDINFRDNAFVYEAEITVKAAMRNHEIAMVPITYYNRLGGISGHGWGWREPLSIIITGIKILWFGTLWRLNLIR